MIRTPLWPGGIQAQGREVTSRQTLRKATLAFARATLTAILLMVAVSRVAAQSPDAGSSVKSNYNPRDDIGSTLDLLVDGTVRCDALRALDLSQVQDAPTQILDAK